MSCRSTRRSLGQHKADRCEESRGSKSSRLQAGVLTTARAERHSAAVASRDHRVASPRPRGGIIGIVARGRAPSRRRARSSPAPATGGGGCAAPRGTATRRRPAPSCPASWPSSEDTAEREKCWQAVVFTLPESLHEMTPRPVWQKSPLPASNSSLHASRLRPALALAAAAAAAAAVAVRRRGRRPYRTCGCRGSWPRRRNSWRR